MVLWWSPMRDKIPVATVHSEALPGAAKPRSCQLLLSDERVSRHHLGVRESEGRYLVRDLGSKNGTLYEGSLVTEVRVGPGATFKVGRSFLRIQPRPQPLEVTPSQAR